MEEYNIFESIVCAFFRKTKIKIIYFNITNNPSFPEMILRAILRIIKSRPSDTLINNIVLFHLLYLSVFDLKSICSK